MMNLLLNKINYYFYLASAQYNKYDHYKNKDIQDWFLLNSPWPTIFLTLGYLILVTKLLPLYMKNRQEYALKRTIFVYNLLAMLLNIYIIFKIVSIKLKKNDFTLCSSIKVRGHDESSSEITSTAWLFYVLKLVELSDTILFILRKRFHRLTFLHIYHHSSMFVIWWIGVNYLADGYIAIPILLNSFVHAVMYSYYFLSALGYKHKSWLWWKKYLSIIQMLQFCILITISTFLLRENCDYKISEKIIWFGIYYSLSHLIIFFYSYIFSYYGGKIENHSNNHDHAYNAYNSGLSDKNEYRLGVTKRRPLRSP